MVNDKCFVICPIGAKESDTRRRSEKVFKHIICKALDGYDIIRADQIPKPGQITTHVMEHIIECHTLVADLTDNNANVFYELALRHALGKPAILIIQADQEDLVPFDLKDMRVITYDTTDPDAILETVDLISSYAEEASSVSQDNVISRVVTLAPRWEPVGHNDLLVTLGTIEMGSRFRYELIEPFFERLDEEFNERLEALGASFTNLMEEAKNREYLKRVKVIPALSSNSEMSDKMGELFDDVELIIPQLSKAMMERSEEGIVLSLGKWQRNNKEFMKIAAKRLLELAEADAARSS